MHNRYQQEAYDPTDDIVACIDQEDVDNNAPTAHDILLTHDESPLQDRSTYEMLIEQHSMGIAFLKAIAADVVREISNLDIPGLRGKIEESKWESLMKQQSTFEMNPLLAECPKFVLATVNALAETRNHDEVIWDLLTWKDKDGKRKPKWPNSFKAIYQLLIMAQRNQDDWEVISLLTDSKGVMRFPEHKGATKMLVYAYRKTNQPLKITELLDALDLNSDIWNEEDVCRQYIQALNLTARCNDAIEKFMRNGKIMAPCAISHVIVANIANSLNLAKRYQEAYTILEKWMHNSNARDNKFFTIVASTTVGNMGMHRKVIMLLADRNGECKYSDNAHAVRILIYAFINTDRVVEAEQLFRGATKQNIFTGEESMAIDNAFKGKRYANLQAKW